MTQKGFTLIETMVAVSIFSLLVVGTSGIFYSSLKSQREVLSYQELLGQTSYVLEYMSRAVRMAQKDISGSCTGTAKLNYEFSNQCLKFRNYKDQCQQFCLDGARIKDENGNYLTSANLQISAFNIGLNGETQNDDSQPKIVISFDVSSGENLKIRIQTMVSQRNLDIRR